MSNRWMGVFFLVLVVPPLALSAQGSASLVTTEVQVELQIPGKGALTGEETEFPSGTLTAVSLSVPNLEVMVPLTPPKVTRIELPVGQWRIFGDLPGYWVTDRYVEVGDDPLAVTFDVLPAGRISGSARLEKGEEAPQVLLLFLRSPPGSDLDGELDVTRARCDLEPEGRDLLRWGCVVPAVEIDARLQAPGFVPKFLWGFELEPGADVDVGEISLIRGAGVQGWVVSADGEPLGQGVELELIAAAEGAIRDRQRARSQRFETKTNKRGFFQILGVPPGRYRLVGTAEGYAPSRTSVEVTADQMTEVVNPPLVLHPPARLEGFVLPALDPNLEEWTVRIAEFDRAASRVSTIDSVEVASDGSWSITDLSPGQYILTLLASDDQKWHSETLEIGGDPPVHFIEVNPVEVEGQVTLGGVELEDAAVLFGGRFGAVRVDATTDEDGQYEAVLPREGGWIVEVAAESPRIRRELRDVEIKEPEDGSAQTLNFHLPNTFVIGEVVDENGRPISDALVNFRSTWSEEDGTEESMVQVTTEADGTFELLGVRAGPALLGGTASERRRVTPLDIVVVEDEETGPFRLVARSQREILGLVGSDFGPVPGARIKATPIGGASFGVGLEASDPRGRFSVWVPPATRELRLAFGAQGFAYRMLRVPVPEDQPIGLRLSQEAGDLELAFDRPVRANALDEPVPFLFHGGGYEGFFVLVQWAFENGVDFPVVPDDEPWTVTIPKMEPGEYRLCWVMRGEIGHLDQMVLPGTRCTSGFLTAGGSLRLDAPNL